MLQLLADVKRWRARRAALEEEWDFHRDRAALELEDAGLSPAEARAIAGRRLGRRSTYWREALVREGADWRGLLRLWVPRPATVQALAIPAALVLLIIFVIGANPYRHQVLSSLNDHTNWAREAGFMVDHERYAPIKPWRVPAAWGKITWTLAFITGVLYLRANFRRRRFWLLGVTNLALMTVAGVVLFITAMQWCLAAAGEDLFWEITGRLSVWTASSWLTMLGYKAWKRDLVRRCPYCLEHMRMPVEKGLTFHLLVDPEETESICLEGHGTLSQTWWAEVFREDTPQSDLAAELDRAGRETRPLLP